MKEQIEQTNLSRAVAVVATSGSRSEVHRIEETVARGMCIGCGVCSVATCGAISLKLGPTRLRVPDLNDDDMGAVRKASRVCPFSDESPNESVLDAPTSEGRALPQDVRVGRYGRTFAGRVTDDDALVGSSSGGLASWLLAQLLERGEVDAVIHVGAGEDELFEDLISGPGELGRRRKSRYFATTLADVLPLIRDDSRRFALVGVPCFITAARALCREVPEYAERLVLFVGLVCGHLKSPAYAESLAWQAGVAPSDVEEVDFRVKQRGRTAGDYLFGIRRRGESEWITTPTNELIGTNWGHGSFQPEACNVCDDIFAETADVVFGDAWLPRYSSDWRGTNVVITRNPLVDEVFASGEASGDLWVEHLPLDEVVHSQAGNYRHRRDGMAVRLADDIAEGLSVPAKRVVPGYGHVTRRRVKLIRKRRALSAASHDLFASARASGDLDDYLTPMRTLIREYRRVESPLWKRGARFARAVLAGGGGVSRFMNKSTKA